MGRRSGSLLFVVVALGAAPAAASAQQGTMLGDETPPATNPFGANRMQAAIPTREEPPQTASPRAQCGPGSRPEPGIQGRIPASAYASGDADKGYQCNLQVLGKEGTQGGFKVERYVDEAGRECAYYDTTLLFPANALTTTLSAKPTGVAVVDMTDPAKPVRTTTLLTPAMQSPHESLVLNEKRGLLGAVMGNPAFAPGFIDLYDVSQDCRNPVLQSSSPVGLLGHESGFSPDGKTFYATSISTDMITAVDVSNPRLPSILGVYEYPSHGLTVSEDGNRGYVAGAGGLQIVDLSQVQARKPSPQVPQISALKWKNITIPQNAIPVTIGGKPMLVEVDEYAESEGGDLSATGPNVGAGRIIDISNEQAPKVISNFRLEVNQGENRGEKIAGDPGTASPAQGYAGHYCGVPSAVDPGIVACSFIASGLRVFDIRDPYAPKELAYFVAPPGNMGGSPAPVERSNYAMSRPSFNVARGEIWYSDGNSGFYALKATNGVWPFAKASTIGLPSARRCASRRAFQIRLRAPKGAKLRSATVTVNGKRVKVRRSGSRLVATVNLKGTAKGTAKVTVVARTTRGKVVRETRSYRPCTRRS